MRRLGSPATHTLDITPGQQADDAHRLLLVLRDMANEGILV